jgi:hypothetical protein
MSEKRPSVEAHDGRVWISGHAAMTPEEAQAFALEIWRKASFGPLTHAAHEPAEVKVSGTWVRMRVGSLPLPVLMPAMGAIYLGRELQGAAWRIGDIEREAGRCALAEEINTALTGLERLRAHDRAQELATGGVITAGRTIENGLTEPRTGDRFAPLSPTTRPGPPEGSNLYGRGHEAIAVPIELVYDSIPIRQAPEAMTPEQRIEWERVFSDSLAGVSRHQLMVVPPLSVHSTRAEWRRANELFRGANLKAAAVFCPVCRAELPVVGEAVGGQADPIEVTEHDWTRDTLSDPPVNRCPGSKALIWVDGSNRVEMFPTTTYEGERDGRTD